MLSWTKRVKKGQAGSAKGDTGSQGLKGEG